MCIQILDWTSRNAKVLMSKQLIINGDRDNTPCHKKRRHSRTVTSISLAQTSISYLCVELLAFIEATIISSLTGVSCRIDIDAKGATREWEMAERCHNKGTACSDEGRCGSGLKQTAEIVFMCAKIVYPISKKPSELLLVRQFRPPLNREVGSLCKCQV